MPRAPMGLLNTAELQTGMLACFGSLRVGPSYA